MNWESTFSPYNASIIECIWWLWSGSDLVRTQPAASQLFDRCDVIYNFFREPKVAAMYGETSVKRILDTQSTGDLDAVGVIVKNFQTIIDNVSEISRSTYFVGDTVTTATGQRTAKKRVSNIQQSP